MNVSDINQPRVVLTVESRQYLLCICISQVSVKHLLIKFKENPLDCTLTRCFVRLLAAIHQFPKELLLDAESMESLRVFCLHTLKTAYKGHSPLAVQNSLDCCTLVCH